MVINLLSKNDSLDSINKPKLHFTACTGYLLAVNYTLCPQLSIWTGLFDCLDQPKYSTSPQAILLCWYGVSCSLTYITLVLQTYQLMLVQGICQRRQSRVCHKFKLYFTLSIQSMRQQDLTFLLDRVYCLCHNPFVLLAQGI